MKSPLVVNVIMGVVGNRKFNDCVISFLKSVVLLTFFFEVKFTGHKINHLMAQRHLVIFTVLYPPHPQPLAPKHFHRPRRIPGALSSCPHALYPLIYQSWMFHLCAIMSYVAVFQVTHIVAGASSSALFLAE